MRPVSDKAPGSGWLSSKAKRSSNIRVSVREVSFTYCAICTLSSSHGLLGVVALSELVVQCRCLPISYVIPNALRYCSIYRTEAERLGGKISSWTQSTFWTKDGIMSNLLRHLLGCRSDPRSFAPLVGSRDTSRTCSLSAFRVGLWITEGRRHASTGYTDIPKSLRHNQETRRTAS